MTVSTQRWLFPSPQPASWQYGLNGLSGTAMAYYPGDVFVNGSIFGLFGNSFSTVAALQAANIPLPVQSVSVLGYNSVGDGGAGIYIRAPAGAGPGKLQDALGNWWQLKTQFASVLQFGARNANEASSSAPIQAAISYGLKGITLDQGIYGAQGITCATQNFAISSPLNAIVRKNANGPLITLSGDTQLISNVSFQGGSSNAPEYNGDIIVGTGRNLTLWNSGARWAQGRAVKITTGRVQIIGTNDIYQTSDATVNGFDIEIGQVGTPLLYPKLAFLYSSQATGGYKLIETGAAAVIGNQFGKLYIDPGASSPGQHGPYVLANRINGKVTVLQSSSKFDADTVSDDFEVGDGVATISGIGVGPTVTIEGGKTFTVNNKVVESLFFLGQVRDGGANIVLGSQVRSRNQIWDNEIPYNPTFASADGNAVLGNGTIIGSFVQRGRMIKATVNLLIGSTTNFGTGYIQIGLPVAMNNAVATIQVGSGNCLNGGRFLCMTAEIQANNDYCLLLVNNAVDYVKAGTPNAWVAGDRIRFTIEYPV